MANTPNILHVTQSAGAAGGGVAKYIWDLHGWLNANNAPSRVVSCDARGHADGTSATVLERRWPAFLGRTDVARWLQQLQPKPNIIHIHGLRCYHNAQAAAWATSQSIPVVVSPHAQLMPYTMARNAPRKKIFDALIERPMLARASAVHFVSEVERQDSAYASIFANKSAVIPIGMNRAQWIDIAPRTIDSLNDERPLIAFFGYLSYRKGLDLLIDALPAILARQPEAKLVVAGGDPENIVAALQQRADALGVSSNIAWHTDIARPQARWLLQRADCFALPSRAESFSIGILEALSLGTPVVASRESTWDTLQQQGFGFNCELSAQSLAQCLLKALETSRAARQRNRALIAGRVQDQFNWDACGARMLELYQRLLAK